MSKNGYLSPAELTTVQGTMQLRTDTAKSWFAMKAAAAHDGVTLTIAGPAGAYRSWATQLDMRAHPGRYNITPGIVSGLPSEHGLGTCADIAAGLAWVKSNGRRFGWTFPLKTDPNHARYGGTTTAGETSTPIATEEDDDMKYIYTPNRGGALVGELGFYPYTDTEYAQSGYDRFGGATVTDRAFDVARQDAINRGNANMQAIANLVAAKIPAASSPAVDASALAAQIAAEVKKLLPASIDTAKLEELIGGIPAAVNSDAAARLATK